MLERFASSSEMADAAAAAAAGRLDQGLRARGRASLVATGGRAPGPVYDRLAQADLDWPRVDVTLSDDRFIPPDSPESNEGLVRRRLLSGKAARARFTPLWSQAATSEAAARDAEPRVAALVPFDVAVLGMGEDGHVASLIPGSPVLAAAMDPAAPKLVMGLPPGAGWPPLARITLTLRALLQSRSIIILIAGETKARVFDEALGGADLPVRAFLVQDLVPVRVLWAPEHGQ